MIEPLNIQNSQKRVTVQNEYTDKEEKTKVNNLCMETHD